MPTTNGPSGSLEWKVPLGGRVRWERPVLGSAFFSVGLGAGPGVHGGPGQERGRHQAGDWDKGQDCEDDHIITMMAFSGLQSALLRWVCVRGGE